MPECELEGQFSLTRMRNIEESHLLKEIASKLVPNNASHIKVAQLLQYVQIPPHFILFAIAGSP